MQKIMRGIVIAMAMASSAWAISAHSAIGKGQTEPEAKHDARENAIKSFGRDQIVSWGRESCEKQIETTGSPQPPGPYSIPQQQRVFFECEIEFTTKD